MSIVIRPYHPGDLEVLRRITIESFGGVSLDHLIESKFGVLNGHDWQWRKARHMDDDVRANEAGIFVAEMSGHIIGYITTALDREAGKARIPNMAITAEARGQGLGRLLLQRALEYFRREGMAYAMIETIAGNAVGEHLYPSCGFEEIGRQIHYGIKL